MDVDITASAEAIARLSVSDERLIAYNVKQPRAASKKQQKNDDEDEVENDPREFNYFRENRNDLFFASCRALFPSTFLELYGDDWDLVASRVGQKRAKWLFERRDGCDMNDGGPASEASDNKVKLEVFSQKDSAKKIRESLERRTSELESEVFESSEEREGSGSGLPEPSPASLRVSESDLPFANGQFETCPEVAKKKYEVQSN